MNEVLTAISTVGFPIVMCVGFAYFIKILTQSMREDSQKREERLMKIIDKQGETLQQIADVLGSISARLERVENILEDNGKE